MSKTCRLIDFILIDFIMGANIKQNNDFGLNFRIGFNGENDTTIIATRARLKTAEFTA